MSQTIASRRTQLRSIARDTGNEEAEALAIADEFKESNIDPAHFRAFGDFGPLSKRSTVSKLPPDSIPWLVGYNTYIDLMSSIGDPLINMESKIASCLKIRSDDIIEWNQKDGKIIVKTTVNTFVIRLKQGD